MTESFIIYMCTGVGLCCALVAGTFQAFSEFVMKALIAANPLAGIESMQLINRVVYRTTFLAMLLGLMPVSLGLALYAYFTITHLASIWIISGAIIYLVFVFMVTMFGNVPMNNRLDGMSYDSDDAASYWKVYGISWTRLNHIRTLGSVSSSICFLTAGILLA